MSDAGDGTEYGRHHFLAWARQGIVSTLTNQDTGAPLPVRGSLTVGLDVVAQNPSSSTPITPVAVQTFGPGDVLGIDPRHVVRTEPRDSTTNFEPNYLAGIEFDSPDLPWLFTPAAPAGDRIRPWITLIVLALSEFTPVRGLVQPLPAIDVTSIAGLQPLDDAWNWAHAQVSGEGGLAGTASSSPASVISRLLCPRRLDPETAYTAFVVPTFEIGRLAGLGMDTSAVASADVAWTPTTGTPLRLPVLYQWQFHTSDQGDFESLVRRLTPRQLGAEIGQRPMGVDDPMADFPSAGAPLGLDGALKSLVTTESSWDDPAKTQFQTALQSFVNRTSPLVDNPDDPDPQVVPPIYGRWPAGLLTVSPSSSGWLDELNLDPRNRVAAGMGTQVVQSEQTALMASAWQQVAGIEAANAALRGAQLARATMTALHTQVSAATQGSVLSLTAPLHARILATTTTVRAAVDASRVPVRILSPIARRLTSAVGVLARRQVALAAPGATAQPTGSLLLQLNANTVAILPPVAAPAGLVSIEDVEEKIPLQAATTVAATQVGVDEQEVGSAGVQPSAEEKLSPDVAVQNVKAESGPVSAAKPAPDEQAVGADEKLVSRPEGAVSSGAKASGAGGDAGSSGPVASADPGIGVKSPIIRFNPVRLSPVLVAQVPPRPGFTVTAPGIVAGGGTVLGGASGTTDSAEAGLFRQALSTLTAAWNGAAPDAPLAAALDLPTLSSTIVTRIDPVTTIPNRVLSLVSFAGLVGWHPVDPIREIMAAPSFPQAMYEPLRDLSEQYVLPGADQIPPDTVGLLETNHAFIEAYMVGLSHEMARQLLFAGYPTDCMGTYFRQFWDVSGYVPVASDPTDPAQLAELLRDIPPIVTWPLAAGLGQHENRTSVVPDNVVLIIRGELLRRYPDAIIYAAKATVTGGKRVIDPTDERYPIFGGSLSGDMNFLGFNLSKEDAKGGTTAAPQGFFFVFQQHPTGPRFGLEPSASGPVTAWADLAWTNFGGPQSPGPAPAKAAAPAAPAPAPAGQPAVAQPAISPIVEPAFVGPWSARRLLSSTFASVLAARPLPSFLSAGLAPEGVSVTGDDAANRWGVDAAQTAYITARLPFRVAIHADLMVPPS